MSSYDVSIHALGTRPEKNRKYRVRWRVAEHRHEKSFSTSALADNYRAKLMRAAQAGEAFDEVTGLPVSELRRLSRVTWYQHARDYLKIKWPSLAAKSRRSTVESLTTLTVALVQPARGRPDDHVLRRAVYAWGLNPGAWSQESDQEIAAALEWLDRASLPIARLSDRQVVRLGLDACTRRLDGSPAAATTVARKRAVFYNALGYAVERGHLTSNPIDQVQWTAPAVAEAIDRRVVANTRQVERILAQVPDSGTSGPRLVAFYSCIYYAGMRPSEVARLRIQDCDLPENGWGRLVLWETAPYAGARWTDDGALRQVRGLKHRGRTEARPVPIPPVLVQRLHDHLARFATTEDGRLFQGVRGADLSESVWDRTWKRARKAALDPVQVASPLARRPYDLRHAAVSLWLNAGVPPAEVARRVGHSVAVLLKVYANCVDGDEVMINERITKALRGEQNRGSDRGQRGDSKPTNGDQA